ncbi:hypothetical protein NPIL_620751 [Nephila pilipes]|uniref:Uncharacterized protein n=1 Tax=Nephila pilipes TaxID=299642 RepID=A0A8X6NTL0_NEPPI|nr:hypothetical protein NPIL_620751 [Nephila pilipes]
MNPFHKRPLSRFSEQGGNIPGNSETVAIGGSHVITSTTCSRGTKIGFWQLVPATSNHPLSNDLEFPPCHKHFNSRRWSRVSLFQTSKIFLIDRQKDAWNGLNLQF